MLTQSLTDNRSITALEDIYCSPRLILQQLDELIEKHYLTQKAPEFYSAILCQSLKTLNNLTKAKRNKTVFALIQDRTLQEAKKLLAETNAPVKRIAYHLGFEEPDYFCRFFKKMTGMRPRDFRTGSRDNVVQY